MSNSLTASVGALALTTSALLANGGGFRYGIEFTGGVTPFEPSGTERVQILDEKLDITLYRKDAEVRVRYVMKNITKRKATVTFGFPVEVTDLGLFALEGNEPDAKTIASRATRYCRDYWITADGERLPHKQQIEPFALGRLKPFRGSEQIAGIGAWKVSTLRFAPGQQRLVEIRYGVDHDVRGRTTSDDSHADPPVFRYRLSTGGVWAGPIANGRVTVKLSGVDPKWLEFKKPAGRFKRDGELWVWNFENLEPTLADDLEIIAGPERHEFAAGGDGAAFYIQTDRDFYKKRVRGVPYHSGWQYLNKTYSVSASSTLPTEAPYTYGAENIKNWDWVTDHDENSYSVWSEGVEGHGIGERLTLNVSKPLPLDEIRIQPGHGRDETLFKANSRPSQLKVTLNGEHTFEARLRDANVQQFIPVEGYDEPVETVMIEIAGVYEGWQWADTCISDIALISPLAEEPKRYGAR